MGQSIFVQVHSILLRVADSLLFQSFLELVNGFETTHDLEQLYDCRSFNGQAQVPSCCYVAVFGYGTSNMAWGITMSAIAMSKSWSGINIGACYWLRYDD